MKIYIDFDDVLARTMDGLLKILKELTGKVLTEDSVKDFNLHVSFGLSDDEYSEFMRRAHLPESIMSYLPMDGAVETIRGWKDSGHEPVIVTGRPSYAYDASRAWLEKYGLSDVELVLVDKYGRPDSAVATPNAPRAVPFAELSERHFDLAIDDGTPALELIEKYKLCPYMVYDRPWNRSWKGDAPRAANWSEVRRIAAGFR